MTPPTPRWTLRDLPLPAKLVVSTFLVSVGLGYLWAMAQIHFKHAAPGDPLPAIPDLVARFSGVPWPTPPKPEAEQPKEQPVAKAPAAEKEVPGVKVKTILNERCVVCHKADGEKDDVQLTKFEEFDKYLKKTPQHAKGHLHTVLTGSRKSWSKQSMTRAFFDKAPDWEDMPPGRRQEEEPKREAERLVLVAWVEAGAAKKHYEADAFPIPEGFDRKNLRESLLTTAKIPVDPVAAKEAEKKPAVDPWKEAKSRQLSVDALTQSTHAHLLSFSVLWALTGLVFAFTSYPGIVRGILGPIVLVAQVADVMCWWLARLPDVGPYFAMAIMATGGIVGLGLVAQITLSLWNMYGPKGKAMVVLLFLTGAGLFGLAYVKVIDPQLKEEKAFVAGQAK